LIEKLFTTGSFVVEVPHQPAIPNGALELMAFALHELESSTAATIANRSAALGVKRACARVILIVKETGRLKNG
jgi:hypothetical protein